MLARSAAVQGGTATAAPVRQQPRHQRQPLLLACQPLQLHVAGAAAALLLAGAAHAATPDANFAVKCIGCHVGGGNVIQAGATLQSADLECNGFADGDSLYRLIYSGKGRMPGFGADCAPKGQCTFGPRLSDDEVTGLAQYVLDQAARGWQPQQ